MEIEGNKHMNCDFKVPGLTISVCQYPHPRATYFLVRVHHILSSFPVLWVLVYKFTKLTVSGKLGSRASTYTNHIQGHYILGLAYLHIVNHSKSLRSKTFGGTNHEEEVPNAENKNHGYSQLNGTCAHCRGMCYLSSC